MFMSTLGRSRIYCLVKFVEDILLLAIDEKTFKNVTYNTV